MRIVGKMDDEEEEVLSCAGMFWIDAAKKMALDCCPWCCSQPWPFNCALRTLREKIRRERGVISGNAERRVPRPPQSGGNGIPYGGHSKDGDDDSLPRSDGSETVGDGTVLKREDMVVHGLCPARDEFFLVVCEQCQMLVKPQALAYHIDLRHRMGVGESHSAFLSSTPSSNAAAPTEKALPRKRPTIAKPCEAMIGDAVIKSTICRRRRSRRAKVKGRSRLAPQTQRFDPASSSVASSGLFPVGVDATPGNPSSVFAPRMFGGGSGGLANELLNQRLVDPSVVEAEGLNEGSRVDSRSPGRGIIIRFAQLNRGKGTWIAEMGSRPGGLETRDGGPVLLKGPSRNDDLRSLSFNVVQTADCDDDDVSLKGNEVPSFPSDWRSQLAEGHDLDVSAMDTLKRRKPLPSVFKHRKICPEPPPQDSAAIVPPSFAHSNVYRTDGSIQFPLPLTIGGGSCFSVVPTLMSAVHFQDRYSSVDPVVNGDLECKGQSNRDGGNIGTDVQTYADKMVSTIPLQPSIPVPFRPPRFAPESWIEPGSDVVVGVRRSLGSGGSRSWCHSNLAPPGASSIDGDAVGSSLRLGEDGGFVGLGLLAQAPSLSGSRGDSDEVATRATADLFHPVECQMTLLPPPWKRGTGEATWNSGTGSDALEFVHECPLVSSTVSVVINNSAHPTDVSSDTFDPTNHDDVTSSNSTAGHREASPFHGYSDDDEDPSFPSTHVHPDMLSHVEPPSAAAHFSSKFHLTSTTARPMSVGAQALTSAPLPCTQPWLCRIGANDS